MTKEQGSAVLQVMLGQVRQTRAAYYTGVAGVTYEDMRDAAKRYLTMKATIDKAAGRRAPRSVTAGAVAGLLRAL